MTAVRPHRASIAGPPPDAYAELLHGTRGLEREHQPLRDAWFRSLALERKEELLFEFEILLKGVINLGVAVDTDAGLMVPVLRDADRLSIVELSDGVKRLAARFRGRSITREERLGGTFTISTVGSAKERVLVKDGRFYAGLVLPLSISCDHRVVDGAEAARFLNTVVKLLEDPGDLLG